jgi:hypothetical protein
MKRLIKWFKKVNRKKYKKRDWLNNNNDIFLGV